MANTRTVKNPGIWAGDALTTIPSLPSQGVSYRDPVAGTDDIREGWPYATKVESQEYNEIMYRLTSLLDLVDRRGVLGWHDQTVYSQPAAVFGSDGQLYLWQAVSGPTTPGGARDPITEPAYWRTFSAVYNPPQPAATTAVAGISRYATPTETQIGTVPNAAVTPAGLAALTALATRAGLTRYADAAETQTGAIGNAAVTPAGLITLTGNTGRKGLVRQATVAETLALAEPDAVITPAALGQLGATTTQVGIIRFATNAEALGSAVNNAALTPASLSNRVASTSQVGITRYATTGEALNDAIDYAALTPNALAARTATSARAGISRFASIAEARAGLGGVAISADILRQSARDDIPVCSILIWPTGVAPQPKYTLCEGGFYNPATFPEAFAVLGYTYGNSGGNFGVPDYRGMFVRGRDNGRGLDVDGRIGGGAVGSVQGDGIRTHTHTIPAGRLDTPGGPYVNSDNVNDFGTVSTGNNAGAASETRPVNMYVTFIIKLLP